MLLVWVRLELTPVWLSGQAVGRRGPLARMQTVARLKSLLPLLLPLLTPLSFPLPPPPAGISSPLYEIIDCLFQLQTRGFFRRQVFAVARQALSLVAGEAIDSWLVAHLQRLREQHTVGRIIQRIQAGLWPGGVW